jgi:hypothetical protein
MKELILKLQMDSLLQNNTSFLNEDQELNLEEALDDFFRIERSPSVISSIADYESDNEEEKILVVNQNDEEVNL